MMRLFVLHMGNTLSEFVTVEAVECGDTSHRDCFS
jgi:hypothetical protein